MLTSNTCKNCIFWKRQDLVDKELNYFGECSCPKFNIGYSIYPPCKGQKDVCWVEGDEGWGFSPAEDFGCIHFKGKENDNQ